ncbi:AAA family ATPase [Actinomadura yumaensis]|uniref:AAA family ATPase n=3 Tax=Actinomadura TaxID=1988 RepID=A0ABW2CEC0_9ACTN
MGQDPFAAAERDTRAMVAAAWWPSAPPQQRQHAIGGRMLVLPDGTWWLFGAWARWYRLHPSDGQWYLCPPPRSPAVRMAARPAQQGAAQVPALPPHVVPAGPDFSYDPPAALPFVGHGLAGDLTSRVRATVESAATLSASEYPHWWSQFTPETPSTVVVAWGVMLWCASAPAFDARLDAQMLDLWKPYRAKPLPDVDGPRWLTPPALESLVGLYSERLRAGRVDAAVVVLRTMWAVASALREDVRFQIRADALLAILGTTLNNPTVDYGALPYGDQALVQEWLTRCPPHLVPALRSESSPGDNFRHAFYTLSEAIADIAGDPSDPAYIEPRHVAAAMLAADLDVVRKDVANGVVPWLDPEIRYTVQAVSEQKGHPLRHLWPSALRLPEPLRSAAGSGASAESLLAAMYVLDLAWCRLAGGMPARPRGFPVPTAIIAGIIGTARTRATAGATTSTPTPGGAYNAAFGQPPAPPSPFGTPGSPGLPGSQSQPGIAPGAPPVPPPGTPAQPDRPFVQPPAQPGLQDAPGPAPSPPIQGQQAAFAPPDPHFGPPSPTPGDPTPYGAAGGAGAPDPYGGAAGGVAGGAADPYRIGAAGPYGAAAQASGPYGGGPGGVADPYAGGGEQQHGESTAPDDEQDENIVPPYTELGFQRAASPSPGHGGPMGAVGAAAGASPMGAPPPPPVHGEPPVPAGAYGHGTPPGPSGPPGPPVPEPQAAGAAFGMPGPSAGQPPQPPQPPPPHGAAPGGAVPGGGGPQFGGPPGASEPPSGISLPEEEHDDEYVPPYTQLGYQPSGAPPAHGLPPGAGVPPSPIASPEHAPPPAQQPGPGPSPQQIDPYATRMEDPPAPSPVPPPPATPGQPGPPGPPATPGPPGPPATPGPPGTRVLGMADMEMDEDEGEHPGTRVMSETMVGNFDFLDDTPSPERPVHEIPPPQDRGDRRTLERFGIGFVSGQHDAGELLDELRAQIEEWNDPADEPGGNEDTRVDGAGEATRVDGARPSGVPGVLLVGHPHTGQRRLARMIALTLADAGIGDGALRAHDAEDVRDAPVDRITGILRQTGPAILFERLDVAITSAQDPVAVAAAVRRARRDRANVTPLIATCEPRAYKRLLQDHPKLVQAFRVHRMPDLADLDNRMTLLHLLADERRVTVGGAALETARDDLERLRGPGDLVNARLVETYLDQACQRSLERAGASRDRLVLTPDDLAGVAEGIEPALRPPGDIGGYLRQLDQLMGLDEVKAAVRELADEAALEADRARYGVAGDGARHLVFVGPPGTGKTTVAGLVGGIYAALGLLESGHVVACRPVHLAGRDRIDTESRVASMVEQAHGGVLLIQEAYRLDRTPAVVDELRRHMNGRGARFVVVCSSPAAEMEGFLAGNPALRGEFGRVLEFTGMGDRDLVRLFQNYAERDLYMLDEELRVELLSRFERLRGDPAFAYARTVRLLFEQTVARQAARLAGADVNAATVARLTDRDLPESPLEQMLGDFHQGT